MNLGRDILLDDSTAGTVRFLSGLHAMTLEEGKTQSWVTVTRTGSFDHPKYGRFEISRELLLKLVESFNSGVYGQDIFYDVAHKPENGAAGKILKMKVEGDRLRALVDWTPYGIDAIKNKGYAYSSVEYHENYKDNESGNLVGSVMFGAALVTRPHIKRLDPIQLSEADGGDVPTLLHPELQSTLLQEIQTMHKILSDKLRGTLAMISVLSEQMRTQLMSAFEAAMAPMTDEKQAQALMEAFANSGKQLAEQITAGNKDIKLSLDMSGLKIGLTADDVRKLMADEATAQATSAKKLAEGKDANVKLLSDTINAATGLDEATKKSLAESVADLVTPEMTADQVKRLAENQIKHGNDLAVARQLSGMGFARPAGSVQITVDSTNEVKALQEQADKRLGIATMQVARRFSNTGGQLQAINKEFAEKVLAQFDVEHGAQLHSEHKMLAGGAGLVSDVSVPAIFERTVIREALYNMIGLQFVDVGTLPFSATALIPYSFRDTTAAGISNTRVYEGGAVPRAGVRQTSDTAYPIPQKIAFEVSDELRYLTGNGQLDWDVTAENARNAARIIGEDSERLIFNEILQASEQFATTSVVDQNIATANGTFTIFPLDSFPVVRPSRVFDLQGNQVGATLYGVVVKSNAVVIVEYNGTNTQGAGLYYTMDFNLGEIRFVTALGAPSAPLNTHLILCSYTFTTNVFAFNTDQGAVATDLFWDTLLYRYGLRKNVIESDRFRIANFGLMSGTIRTQIEQARSFIETGAHAGTALDTEGNLGPVKGVANFRTTAPGLQMGDQRIIIGERGATRFRMMKPWTMGQMVDQKDANGRFTGRKEAYGDQFIVLHTPTQLKAAYTSLVLFGGAARVDRA